VDDLATEAIPRSTVSRLPVYLRALLDEAMADTVLVSSSRLSVLTGVHAATVRKDLAWLGSHGMRGVGYDVRDLVDQISRTLGLHQVSSIVIVGVGNIGRALAGYAGFAERGFPVVALFDADAEQVGSVIGGLGVQPMHSLPTVIAAVGPAIGIVAVPAEAAQDVVDRLVAAGVTSILSFQPNELTVPPNVVLRNVDLAVELQILACMHSQSGEGPLRGTG
jgi:redox-sensing transcriptional repressor